MGATLRRSLVLASAVAGVGAEVRGDPTWETRIRFRLASTSIALPQNTLNLSGTGTYTFVMQVGIFNLQGAAPGDANHGLFGWSGRASATGSSLPGETLGVDPSSSRMGVFNFGAATSFGGFVANGGATIDGSPTPGSPIVASRAVNPTENVVWAVGAPQPTAPAEFASEGYTDVFRFTVLIQSIATLSYVVTFQGGAGPVLGWDANSVVPPDGSTPGSVNFLGRVAPTPFAPHQDASLILHRVPTPGTIATLALGGVLAMRRKRSRQADPLKIPLATPRPHA